MAADIEGTEIIRLLFQERVPEVTSGAVKIRQIARELGVLSILVVHSAQAAPFNAVGACASPAGSHLKEISKHLRDEHLTVVRWSESVEQLIQNLVAPNLVAKISFDDRLRVATGVLRSESGPPLVHRDSTPVQTARLKLASRLVGWDIQIDSQNAN